MKVVVITGGTSGIGKATADMLRAKGDTVLTLARSSGADYQVDVTDGAQVKLAMDSIGATYGHIDVLINNAGFGLNGVLELTPMDKVMHEYDVNLFGTIRCIQLALPYMSKGSRIINIGSAMVFLPMPYRSMYASSKSAVVSMSYALRSELKPLGIDVVVVNPANIKTNFTANKQVVVDTNDRYGDRPARAQAKFDNDQMESRRIPVDKVARVLTKIVNKKSTKPMYIVGGKMKLAYFAMKFVTLKCVYNMVAKYCN